MTTLLKAYHLATRQSRAQNDKRRQKARCRTIVTVGALVLTALRADADSLDWNGGHDSAVMRVPRPFTVTDSVNAGKLVAVARDGSVQLYSPDHKFFAVVLQRGNLSANANQAQLIVFKQTDIEKCLWSKGATNIERSVLATRTSRSNDQPISQLQWATNDSLRFVGLDEEGVPQLSVVRIPTKTVQTLTHLPNGVVGYGCSVETCVVTTPHSAQGSRDATVDHNGGFSIADEELYDFLPEYRPNLLQLLYDTYVVHVAVDMPIAPEKLDEPPTHKDVREGHQLDWISADGHFAIEMRRIELDELPAAGKVYRGLLLIDSDNRTALSSQESSRNSRLFTRGTRWDFVRYVLIDTVTHTVRPLNGAPAAFDASSYPADFKAVWLPDNRHVIVSNSYLPSSLVASCATDACVEPGLIEVDSVTGKSRKIRDAPKRSDVEEGDWIDYELDPSNSQILIITRKGSNGVILPSLAVSLGRATSGESSALRITHDAGSTIEIVLRESLNDRPMLLAHDPESRSDRILLDPSPDFAAIAFGRTESVKWSDSSGNVWTGGLIYPPDYVPGKRYPLVIQTYGFSDDKFIVDGPFSTAFAARALSARGMLVLQTSLGPRVSADPVEEAQQRVDGYASAAKAVESMGLVEQGKVGLLGFSRTGYYAKVASAFSKLPFTAIEASDSIGYGYLDFVIEAPAPVATAVYTDAYQGVFWGPSEDAWLARAVDLNLDKVKSPIRIEAIGIGSLIRQWDYLSGLRVLHKPVEFCYFPEGVHELRKPKERYTSLTGTVDWFDFWLNGHEDGDPGKGEQYTRWREFRTLRQRDAAAKP